MLQANFYYDLQRLFSAKDCLVYPNRFDEYFAITNGLSVADHLVIENELSTLYKKLKLSLAVGNGGTPYQANLDAYKTRNMGEPVTKKARIFAGAAVPFSISNSIPRVNEFVQIMHIDMNNSADIVSKLSPYEITSLIFKLYARLSEEFLKKESLTFFLGGDNFMVVSNAVAKHDAQETIEKITRGTNIKLNCGIGIGRTGRRAANAATKALDTIRDLRHVGKDQPVYEVECL
jgi:GTP cyclohydrolase IIa